MRAILRGASVELDEWSGSVGAALEYLLCDAFAVSDVPYWCDGVELDAVALQRGSTVLVRGLAWCADDRDQWRVPVEVELQCVPGNRPCLVSVLARVGDEDAGVLEPMTREARWPERWLYEYRIESW